MRGLGGIIVLGSKSEFLEEEGEGGRIRDDRSFVQ
jgi:hypothetical protein